MEQDKVRIELENLDTVVLPRQVFPEGIREGDVLFLTVDPEETAKRKQEADALWDQLMG